MSIFVAADLFRGGEVFFINAFLFLIECFHGLCFTCARGAAGENAERVLVLRCGSRRLLLDRAIGEVTGAFEERQVIEENQRL